jgi:PAS domain S-box-containing protein
MRTRVPLMIAAALLACLSAGPAAAAPPFPAAPAVAAKSIRIVMDDNYPPFAFRDAGGGLQGILIDRWRLWERVTGIRAEVTGMDWGEALTRMKAGEFDVIDTIFLNDERSAWLDFGRPYEKLEVPIFFRGEIPGITDAASLRGFVVAVKAGDAAIGFLRGNGVRALLEYPSYEAIVGAARDGKVNVFVVDRPPALHFLYRMGIADRFRRTAPLYVGEFHRAVRKGDAAVLRAVEDGFAGLPAGALQEIDSRWYGSEAGTLAHGVLRILPAAAAGLFGVAFLLLLWNRSLKRKVAAKTRELTREVEVSNRRAEALQKSEESLKVLSQAVEQSPVSILITDADGAIEYVNPRLASMTGYLPEELAGKTPRVFKSGETDPATYRELWAAVTSGEMWEGELHNRRKDGTLFWERIVIAPVRDREGATRHFIALKEDVTERRELGEKLRRAQKMEAIGRMAGGVAHDFNNILSAIMGFASLGKIKDHGDGPARGYLDQILVAAERGAVLTRSLLTFSRSQPLAPRPLDLGVVALELREFLQRVVGEEVALSIDAGGGPVMIEGERGQVEQVLMNLAANARDAMPGGGRLAVAISAVEVGQAHSPRTSPLLRGRHAVVTVADTGVGMDLETQRRIFDPFFTTKEPGKGTGLGMSIVYGIVRQHRGEIAIDSEPGRGTTITLVFPLSAETTGPAAGAEKAAPARGGSETILVAEDDAVLRDITRSALEEFGYRVLEAADGVEAVEAAKREGSRVSLVVMDGVMPAMSGTDAAREIRRTFPELPILFITGYSPEVFSGRFVLDGRMGLLLKPVDPAELARRVREMLDAPGPSTRRRP